MFQRFVEVGFSLKNAFIIHSTATFTVDFNNLVELMNKRAVEGLKRPNQMIQSTRLVNSD